MTSTIRTSGSLRRRLTVQLLVSSALLTGGLFFIVQNAARQQAEQSQDSILAASVTSILDSVSVRDGEIAVDLPYSALSMLGNVSNDRVFYRLSADGVPVTGYADLPLPPDLDDFLNVRAITADYGGSAVRMVTAGRRLSVGGRPVDVTVSVAQTRDGLSRTLRRISRDSVLVGAGFFAVAAVLALLAAQSAVRPLDRLAASVSRRGPQDLRPVAGPVPTEMEPLVRALNRFIARLKVTLTRSEDFIADAAHHVRTPLATVRTQAEVVLRRVEKPENRTALRQMIRAIDESSRAAGQLLDHAMVTFRNDQQERNAFDLVQLTAETVQRSRPVAEMKDIAITVVASTPVVITGDAILIQNALANILDNAIKYSPSDSDISVHVLSTDGTGQIRVSDQGPGFPSESAQALKRRFARGDNASGTIGSGLGLTIAEEVAAAHGGQLFIDTPPEQGGACVTLSFPVS